MRLQSHCMHLTKINHIERVCKKSLYMYDVYVSLIIIVAIHVHYIWTHKAPPLTIQHLPPCVCCAFLGRLNLAVCTSTVLLT